MIDRITFAKESVAQDWSTKELLSFSSFLVLLGSSMGWLYAFCLFEILGSLHVRFTI